MRLRVLRVKSFKEATEAELQDAINEWCAGTAEFDEGRGEALFESIDFLNDSSFFYCFVTYVEQ